MNVNKITIKNIMGIEEVEIEPKQVTVISGKNGDGKTTIIEALKSIFKGGQDATLLRKGEKNGDVVLLLDDGTEIKKRVREKSSEVQVKTEKFGTISRSSDYIKKISNLMSVNPVHFLNCKESERLEYLINSIPMKITEEDKKAIQEGINLDRKIEINSIEDLDEIRKGIYDKRRDHNAIVKDREGSIGSLSESLPDDDGADYQSQLEEVEKELDIMCDELNHKCTEIEGVFNKEVETLERERDIKIDALREEIEKVKADHYEKDKALTKKFNEEDQAIRDEYGKKKSELQVEVERLEQKKEQSRKAKNIREMIEKYKVEKKQNEDQSKFLTGKINEIDQLKVDMLSSLPIPGIEIKDGKIYQDGIEYDRLNTAQKVDIAVDLAKLNVGDLGLMFIDGLELLDEENFKLFVEKHKKDNERLIAEGKNPIQLIVTKVSDDSLKIVSE